MTSLYHHEFRFLIHVLEGFNGTETIEQPDCFVLLMQGMERSMEFHGVTRMRSTLLFCGLCEGLNVCLHMPHESV